MKTFTLALFLPALAFASPGPSFYRALNLVETSGCSGPILADSGKALGPFCIHRQYWQDAKVSGHYSDCADFNYSRKVVSSYLRRYAPKAWQTSDLETLARIHNGGPQGASRAATLPYWRKVRAVLSHP